jgi:hypothetical protein
MNDNVKEVQFGPRVPDDLPGILRELADAAERGEITAFVGAYLRNGEYWTQHSANLRDGLVLADLLHARAMEKFRG